MREWFSRKTGPVGRFFCLVLIPTSRPLPLSQGCLRSRFPLQVSCPPDLLSSAPLLPRPPCICAHALARTHRSVLLPGVPVALKC